MAQQVQVYIKWLMVHLVLLLLIETLISLVTFQSYYVLTPILIWLLLASPIKFLHPEGFRLWKLLAVLGTFLGLLCLSWLFSI
ncbi:hypothetical protein ACVRY7_00120 [Streptococcus ictaluri]|uniref:Uncharacterized protein n=1 Tax=Streptococcus ictaluri 707-05 TaxID=764299 RepID=G5JZS4_9STRE|nr:hypothetical protein [Streptococcus ictaluri]EHI70931.1 hypothetical protein STRIC_0788 [Streptococcus ictaluri 707-05]